MDRLKPWLMIMFLLLGIFLLSACENNINNDNGVKQGTQAAVGRARGSPEQIAIAKERIPYDPNADSASDTAASGDTQYPSISTTVSPSNPGLNQPFTLTISATDDSGVKWLSWQSSKAFSSGEQSDVFDCESQKTCANSWEFLAMEEGLHQFTISVEDVSGKKMDNINAQAEVGPALATTSTTTPSTGGTDSGSSALFTCGNNVCEGGESYESCSNDCTLQDIVGTNPGNGACEPGEDANNAPKDCTVINKQCGNNVCDAGEDRLSCYYDCPNDGSDSGSDASCSTNSDCGSKQRCRSGRCETVECTSDYNCKGCARCSDNRCISCGYGAAGYCTC